MHLSQLVSGILLISVLCGANLALAEDVVEVTVEESSSASSPAVARQAIFDRLIQESSVKYIIDIIGQQKFDHNKALIKNKILKNSGKYVLSMKSSVPVKSNQGFSMAVTLKISLQNLQALLLAEGLLYKMEGAPQVLPMVSFQDRVNGQSYSWWVNENGSEGNFVVTQGQEFFSKMRDELREKGFYGLIPLDGGYRNMMPTAFMSENPRTEDLSFLGEFFGSQIVVKGYIRYLKSQKSSEAYHIDVKLVALHSGNGRIVGEVIRTYETDSGPFQASVQRRSREVLGSIVQDLTAQIYDAWKRGTFGSNLLRLAVSGRLDYQQMNTIKKTILDQIRDIRSLKERLFENNRLTFEMDASSGPRQISAALERVNLKGFKLKVLNSTSDSIEVDIKSL